MRPLLVLAAVAAAVVLVLAVVWFAAPRGTSSAAPPPTGNPPAAEPRDEPAVAATAGADDASAVSGAPTRSAIATAGTARASSAAAPAARSGGRVTGEVRDSYGNPIGGARVAAAQGPEATFGGVPLDAGSGAEVFERGRLETVTDGDGRFVLHGARAGRLRLAVRKAGFAPLDRDEIDVPTGESFDLGVLAMQTSAIVDGRVIDAVGRPIAGAHVERVVEPPVGAVIVFDGFRTPGVEVAVTGADGRFTVDQIAPGPFSLRVTTEDHPDELTTGSTERPGERVAVTIELEDGYEIRGRVVGAPPAELARLAVRAAPTDDEPGAERSAAFDFDLGAGSGEVREARLGADATFTLRGLREAMNYALTLRRRGEGEDPFLGSVSARVVAASGASGVEIAYQPESALVFTVVDARTGVPIEELDVEAGIAWRMPLRAAGGASPRSHPGGEVRFPGLRAKSKDERASLQIRATGYRDHVVEGIALTPGADTDLGSIALEPVPLTRVTVVDAATGKPVAGARVTLGRIRDEPADFRGVRTSISVEEGGEPQEELVFGGDDARTVRSDADGVALLTSFEGELARVDVAHGEYATFRSEPFTAPRGSPHELVARLERGGTVRVKLVDARGAAVVAGRIEHRAEPDARGFSPFPGGARGVTDAEGIAVFEHLAAGTHGFRPAGADAAGFTGIGGAAIVRFAGEERDQGTPWSEVEVTEGGTSEVALVAPLRVRLIGTVREGGTALAGATLRLKAKADDGGERAALAEIFGGGPQARTDGSGAYAIEDVGAGDYTLIVSHPTRHMPYERAISIGDVDRRLDLELSIATIEGVVEDAQGTAVAGARVSVERASSGDGPVTRRAVSIVMASSDGGVMSMFGGDAGAEPVLTDSEGRYVLRGVLDGVDLTVTAEAEGFQRARSAPVRVAENQARTGVDLALQKAGRIDVSVFASDGSPASMVLVTARRADGTGDVTTEFVGEGGKRTLDGLAAGAWRVSVRRAGPDGDAAPPEQVVEVKQGETHAVRFDMP